MPWSLHLDNPNYIAARDVYNWAVVSNSSGNIDGAFPLWGCHSSTACPERAPCRHAHLYESWQCSTSSC